ncbi:Dna polymerase gamma [Favolaschia claudopus]|uniref:Dna polymerase gamma n=1 Tax=Favolaschia claudopus TaxID=2862362 RepID=A0AAW0CLU5_9AGAR
MVSSKLWQSPLPMSLVFSLIKHHVGDWKTFSFNGQKTERTWVARVPLDIIIEIAERLTCVEDVLSLSLTSTRIYATLLPVLFTSVDLGSSRMCKVTLDALLAGKPDVARYIRRLVVRPNHVDRRRSQLPPKQIDENWVAQSIVKLATSGRLSKLTSFFWDGSEMPQDDIIWSTLRTCCPELRTVGTNVGPKSISPDSELFRFNDLSGFSLTAKTLPDEWDTFSPTQPELPDQLWDMLIERSPRLEQLKISVLSQRSRRVWDTRRVVQGRWPLLRDLELGNCSMAGSGSSRVLMEAPFMQFLAAHPAIERLQLPSLSSFPRAIVLPSGALPNLREFAGNAAHVKGLPNLARIKTLSLVHQPLSEKMLSLVCGTLKHMKSLTSLSIWLHLDAQTDHYAVFRTLFDSCRRLLHLELSCSEAPWDIIEFTSALRGSRVQLTSLNLTRVECAANEPDLLRLATKLSTTNPSLRRMTLSYSFTTWVFLDSVAYQRIGKFLVKGKSKQGQPIILEKHSKSGRRYLQRRPLPFRLPKWI